MTLTAPLDRSDTAPNIVVTILFAGALATVAFDLFGQSISPLLKSFAAPVLGAKLAPVPLATAVLAKITGLPGKELASLGLPYAVHILTGLTGLIAYPLGWFMVVRPIWQRVAPGLPWIVPAIGYGVALWVFALYFMASLVAGNAPFLGFGTITWVALIGHILFALVAAWVIQARHPE